MKYVSREELLNQVNFHKKLGHYQANLGLIQGPALSTFDPQVIDHYTNKARDLQSRAFVDTFGGLFKRAGLALARIAERRAESRERRESVKQLESLNDANLADIGLSRADIYSLKRGTVTVNELNVRRSNRVKSGADSLVVKNANVEKTPAANDSVYSNAA